MGLRAIAAILLFSSLIAVAGCGSPSRATALEEPVSRTASREARAMNTLPSDALWSDRSSSDRLKALPFTREQRIAEAETKVARVREWLKKKGSDGLLVTLERNFNWVTAGGVDHILHSSSETQVKLLVTPEKKLLIANNVEAARVFPEELDGLGYELKEFPWYGTEDEALKPLIDGKKVACDAPLPGTEKVDLYVEGLYFPVTENEVRKYRWIGSKTSAALEAVAAAIHPGMTEYDIQYLIAREFWYWDIQPTVILSAVDERIKRFRHALPKGAVLQHHVNLNVCARRWGLVVSFSRLVYFGEPDPALARAYQDCAKVDAAMLAASRPGNTLGGVIEAAQKAYAAAGFPDEWKMHHQGGPILVQERHVLAKPGDATKIIPGMVLAWNPTLRGSKFEDTVLVGEMGIVENFTKASDAWPVEEVTVDGVTYRMPTLKVVK